MVDQPGFDERRIGLRMELQRQCVAAMTERLVRRRGCAGKQFSAWRNAEGVAMSMQYRHAFQHGQERSLARFAQLDGRPADLIGGTRVHARTERTGHQLSTQAQTQCRTQKPQTLVQAGDLLDEPWVGLRRRRRSDRLA